MGEEAVMAKRCKCRKKRPTNADLEDELYDAGARLQPRGATSHRKWVFPDKAAIVIPGQHLGDVASCAVSCNVRRAILQHGQ
jgi:hypothetical protein